MIYLINFGSCYKIGITNDLKKRLSTFKTSREKVEVEDLILTPETELDNYFIDIDEEALIKEWNEVKSKNKE